MEDYTGKSYEEAVADLGRKGVQNIAAPVYDFSSETGGVVTGQSVEPSEVVDVESEISFTVSGGDSRYTMPDFTGYQEKDMIRFFTDRNFDVEVHADPYDIDVHTVTGENESQEKRAGRLP